MVRSEMEVVLRCENYVQFDALTVVDFTMLYALCGQCSMLYIGQKPMVYYTGKPIEKGIQTTSHKQNRLLICKQ